MTPPAPTIRYFVTYSGVKLPLNLVNELDPTALSNRNTFFRAYYDADDRLLGFEKIVYGETEMSHRYEYHSCGALKRAEIVADGETAVLKLDRCGRPVGGGDTQQA
jgi:Family of unknown function (DUF6156)